MSGCDGFVLENRDVDIITSDGHHEELCIGQGFVINQACFSGNGSMLYLWASGESANRAYFYNVDTRPATLDGEAVYDKVHLYTKSRDML